MFQAINTLRWIVRSMNQVNNSSELSIIARIDVFKPCIKLILAGSPLVRGSFLEAFRKSRRRGSAGFIVPPTASSDDFDRAGSVERLKAKVRQIFDPDDATLATIYILLGNGPILRQIGMPAIPVINQAIQESDRFWRGSCSHDRYSSAN